MPGAATGMLDRALLDDVVVFVERLGVELEAILRDVEEIGRLHLDGS